MSRVVDMKGRALHVKAPDKSANPECVIPKQPANFPKVAAAIWEELAPQLLKAGLLTNVDGTAFALLCKDIADLERVELMLVDIDKWIDETPNKFKVQSVWLNIRNRFHDDVLKLCKEFGMTPGSRSTLKTNSAGTGQPGLFDGPDDQPLSGEDPYADFGPRVQH